MFSEKAAMFLSGIKCKPMVVYFYIGLIVTYDLAAPVLAWKQTWTPNSVVGNEELVDIPRFQGEENDTDYFKILLQEGDHMLVGAKNKMYNISLVTLQEDVDRTLTWVPRKLDTETCMKKDNSQDKCQNYIQVLGKNNGTYYVCGTNAFEPKCRMYRYQEANYPVTDPGYEPVKELSGIGRCPYDPDHNSTAVFSEGKLYSGTVADLQAKDPLIMESEQRIRTEQHDSNMLSEPNFVNSVEIDDKIYFFLRETAVETIKCRKATFSRVARVCKRDLGGKFDNNWTSFFKARLVCSITGEQPFHFDEIASTTNISYGNYMPTNSPSNRSRMFYAVFNTPENSIWGSAVCAYTYNDVVKAFQGPFKGQQTAHHKWKQISVDKTPEPHPSACPDDSKRLPDKTIGFIRSYPLMDSPVEPTGGAPVLMLTNQQSRFTAIAVDWQHFGADRIFYDIIFVGMADGRVLKAINRGSEGNIESVVIEDIQVLAKDEPVKELKIFYKSGEGKLIVTSKKNIVSIPLHRCEKQKKCGDCIALQDPYCAWQSDGSCRAMSTGVHNIQDCPDGGKRTEKVTTTTTTPEPTKSCPTCKCDCKENNTDIILGVNSQEAGTSQDTIHEEVESLEVSVQLPNSQPCAPKYIPVRSEDQIYTASTLAIASVVSIVVALLVGFLIGYRVSLCRNHTRNTEEMISYEQNFGSLRKRSNRNSMSESHNFYTDPTFHDKLKIQKNILISNNIPQKSPNLPNGSIESKTVTPQQAKTYI